MDFPIISVSSAERCLIGDSRFHGKGKSVLVTSTCGNLDAHVSLWLRIRAEVIAALTTG